MEAFRPVTDTPEQDNPTQDPAVQPPMTQDTQLTSPQDTEDSAEQGSMAKEAGKTTRDAKFDEMLKGFDDQYRQDLMDESLSASQYQSKTAERETDELKQLLAIKEGKEDATINYEDLSEAQKKEMEARLKYLQYMDEGRTLEKAMLDGTATAEQKAEWGIRQDDFKNYAKAVGSSEAFNEEGFAGKDNAEQIRMLAERLDDPNLSEEQRREIRADINKEMRELKQDLERDSRGNDRIKSFIENNLDDAVVQKSGMADSLAAYNASQRERGMGNAKDKGGDRGDDIGDKPVTPDEPPRAGSMDTAERNGRDAKVSEREVAAMADRGEGAIEPVRAEMQDADRVQVQTAGTGQQSGSLGR